MNEQWQGVLQAAGQGMATTGYINTSLGANVPKRASDIESVAKRVCGLTAQIQQLSRSVNEVASSVYGENSSVAPGTPNTPPRVGMMGCVHGSLDDLEKAIDSLRSEVGRLQGL